MAGADLGLFRHVVELDPGSVFPVHDALGPEDAAVFAGVQGGEDLFDARPGERLGGFPAPGGEYLVGVVMVMVAGAAGAVTFMAVVVLVGLPMVMVVRVVPVFPVVVVVGVVPVFPVVMVVRMFLVVPMVMVVPMFLMVPVAVVMMGVLRLPGLVLGPHFCQQFVRQGDLLNGGEDGMNRGRIVRVRPK